MTTESRILVPLVPEDVQLITGVLQDAAERVQASESFGDDVDQPGAGATLGHLCAHWTQMAETDAHCPAVNLNGERLYGVRLGMEEWDLVCAQLSKYSTLLVMASDEDTPDGPEDLSRASHALKLITAITEACGER